VGGPTNPGSNRDNSVIEIELCTNVTLKSPSIYAAENAKLQFLLILVIIDHRFLNVNLCFIVWLL